MHISYLKFLSFVFLFLFFNISYGQNSNQNINLNFFGDNSGISINYEYISYHKKNLLIGSQIGIGFNSQNTLCSGCGKKYMTVPIQFTTSLGIKEIYGELGIKGLSIFNKSKYEFHITPIAGLRYQPRKRNSLNIRLYFVLPGIKTSDELDTWESLIGVSLGATF